jgi:cytochrome c peroxidase
MLTVLVDTPYEALAKQWKADPSIAATTNLTCKNCHNPGRLSSRLEELKK